MRTFSSFFYFHPNDGKRDVCDEKNIDSPRPEHFGRAKAIGRVEEQRRREYKNVMNPKVSISRQTTSLESILLETWTVLITTLEEKITWDFSFSQRLSWGPGEDDERGYEILIEEVTSFSFYDSIVSIFWCIWMCFSCRRLALQAVGGGFTLHLHAFMPPKKAS